MIDFKSNKMITTQDKVNDGHCIKCGNKILDRYYLQTKDGVYHLKCLRCDHCDIVLDDQVNCYNRNGQIYCRVDYKRLFNQSSINDCNRCGLKIENGQFVQRTKSNRLFHLECFKCSICAAQLQPGQLYTQSEQNFELICELHLSKSTYASSPIKSKSKQLCKAKTANPKSLMKNKRNRTSFKLNQMAEMKAYFESNKNPDSAQLNQLAVYTNLQPRVLRVWFQNMRAKTRRNFLQQKSIGPLSVSEAIDLKTSDIDSLDEDSNDDQIHKFDFKNDDSSQFYCHEILKHNQYNWLLENLANQFMALV